MNDRDLALAMDGLVPLRLDRAPAWDDVLTRAGLAVDEAMPARRRPRRRQVRRLVLLVAVVVVTLAIATAVAAALGHNVFGSLSSWLNGAPGNPAPAVQQAAFARRNGASYASFPTRTRLRLLETQTVRGKSFSLLGFRNGGSLCLRLVPTHAPSPQGVNQCVTLRELRRSSVPAVVASTAYYPIHNGRTAAVFGFADDTVLSVRVVHSAGGGETVPVVNNVFLALHAGPGDPIYDPVVQVSARLRNGSSVVLPFTSGGSLVRPVVPSYLRLARVRLPGPTRVQASLPRAEIGWLDRREPRGGPYVPSVKLYGPGGRQVLFSRSIQPDPDDAYRIGLAIMRIERVQNGFDFTWTKDGVNAQPHRVRLHPGMELVCSDELFPLRPVPIFNNCVPGLESRGLFPPGQVITANRMYREAFTRVSGLVADGVSEVDLYLASGRVIPAALHDNAYTVLAPSTQWPAKLVAFDRAGRALEVDVIDAQKSRPVITPCPTAAIAASTPPGATPPYKRLDLATGTVDGRVVLGRTRAAVVRTLGPPSATRGPDLVYGAGAMTVHLARRRGAVRVVSLDMRDAAATDTRIGRVLRLQPVVLQRRIAAAYPALEHGFAYGSEPVLLGCTGTFRNRRSGLEIAFGLDPGRPSHPFLRLSDTRVGSMRTPAGRLERSPGSVLPATLAFTEGTQGKGFHVDLAGTDGVVHRAGFESARSVPVAPVWSPDGSQFLVVDDRGIFVLPANGSSATRVAGVTSAYGFVSWSPDGRRITFQDGNSLFIVNADGSGGLERLTSYAGYGWSWAPDGTRIAYVGEKGGHSALFLVNTVGTPEPRELEVLTHAPSKALFLFPGSWSPDGSRIAFACCSSGYQPNGNWIYFVRPDGSDLKRVYQGDMLGWSPDRRSFLVGRGFNAIWKLFLVRSDGTFLREIPGCAKGCGRIVWLPDSRRIVYSQPRQIYVASVRGSSRRAVAVVHNPFVNFTISPDGSTIAYEDGATAKEHNRRLTIVRIDGSQRRVVADSSTQRFWSPAWRPRPG